jgi:hypothetical protein
MQIIGALEGTGMYLRGKKGEAIIDLGEAHKTDDGFWYFSESYDEYSQEAIMAIAAFLHRVNRTTLVVK